jgi:phosphate transport system substrate-binding protein
VGASSDVLVGLVNLWITRFKAMHPRVTLTIKPPYAGSLGTKELIGQSIDFVFVSRELKPEDVAEFQDRFGHAPTSVPICGGSYRHYGFLDAIAFFVHRDNPIDRLDFAQIDAIFSSTRHRGGQPITTWGQLGLEGEWADKPIRVHGIEPWNGFEEFIRQRVLSLAGKRGEWRGDLHFEKVVFPLAGNVAADRYAIGYSGIAYLDAPVKVLPLAGDAAGPAVAPTYENVATAQYPLSRLVYLNFNKAPGRPVDALLDEFLRFVLSREGQQVVRDHGIFLPLRAEQVTRSLALLEK